MILTAWRSLLVRQLPQTFVSHISSRTQSGYSFGKIPSVIMRPGKSFSSETEVGLLNWTVEGVIHQFTEELDEKDVPESRQSVELITAHVLGKSNLHGVPQTRALTDDQVERVRYMVAKRLQRQPVQYILGEWDFCDLKLHMRPPVFIPRPETEELVKYVTKFLQLNGEASGRFLEVGCGTGAITLALLKAFLKLEAVSVDRTRVACDLTRENAELLDLSHRLRIVHSDISQGESGLGDVGEFDLIVSNPPYISTDDMEDLEPELVRYEDHGALHGGRDGLDVVKHILTMAPTLLKPGGSVWLEVDTKHPAMIKEMVESGLYQKLTFTKTLQDFTRRDRFCVLQKQS